jgi:hypothetical protein
MITYIDGFKKIDLDLSVTSYVPTLYYISEYTSLDLSGTTSVSQQYYYLNDITYINKCFVYFFLKSTNINCLITITIQEYTDISGTLENTIIFTLTNKSKFLNKQIRFSTKYTLITIEYEPCDGSLNGYFERSILDLSGSTLKNNNTNGTIDVIIKNDSTKNTTLLNYNKTGINTYSVIPKRETYSFNAYTNNISTSILVGSYGSIIPWNDNIYSNFGIGYPRDYYVKISSSSNTGDFCKTLIYTYIDSDGNTQSDTINILTWNTYYKLNGTNIVTILKWSFLDYSIMNNEYLYISPNTENDSYSIYGGWASIQCNSIFTVPKNAIAWINSIQVNTTSSVYLSLFRWNPITYMRDIPYTLNNITQYNAIGVDYAGIGGIFNAGETIGWGSSGGAVATYITANITVEYF